MNQDPNYTSLRAVLDEAYAQAATGKGKERHAGGQPFEDQPMQVISDMLGSNDGMAYQAIKKIREGLAMPEPERTVHELLGAIVYVAGIVVRVRRGEVRVPTQAVPLTEAQIASMCGVSVLSLGFVTSALPIARAVERAHGITGEQHG